MILAINDNLEPRAFTTIEGYKYWVERQIEKGEHPDKFIVNAIYDVQEAELPTEENSIDLHQWHCDLHNGIPRITQAKRAVCPDCGDTGEIRNDKEEIIRSCPCHYC